MRTWILAAFAGGAVVGIAIMLGSRAIHKRPPERMLLLRYSRPTGEDTSAFAGKVDPAPKAPNVTSYAIQIARHCGVKSFETESNEYVTDVNAAATIRVSLDQLTDASFKCLASFTTPPYVTLAVESAS